MGDVLFENDFKIQATFLFIRSEMNIWIEEHIKELKCLSENGVTDKKIANELSIKFNKNFSQGGVKKKRQKLKIFKIPKKLIDETTFYIKVKKRKIHAGYSPAYFPIELAKKVCLKDKDIIICKLKGITFVSKIKKTERKDRNNDYFKFYIPYGLLQSNSDQAEEKVIFLKKIEDYSNPNLEPLIEKGGDIFIDLYVLKLKSTNRIKAFLNAGKLWVWSGRVGTHVELPRYIKLNEKLVQSLGLFQGEGSKNNLRRVEIVNSDFNLINLFLECFEENFLAPRVKWRAKIIYTNLKKSLQKEKKFKKIWSKQINIPFVNFTKTKLFVGNPIAECGSLHLYLPDVVFREVWFSILNNITLFLTKKIDYSKWFMQGVLAADGSPIISNSNLDYIQIRIENQKEIDLYSQALKKLGITINSNLKYKSIKIQRQQNLLNVFNHKLFNLHKKRNFKFLNGLYNKKRIQPFLPNRKEAFGL
ncbi:MAG: hypothetical protein AB1467_03050 [Candidatus Diapherotrites archaeon]